MDVLYVISGITGMTGNELVRQLLNQSENTVKIIFMPAQKMSLHIFKR